VIDFTKDIEERKRQDSVCVDGDYYEIHTEFFHWVGFGRKLIKWKDNYEEFDYLYTVDKKEDGDPPDVETIESKAIVPENRQAGFAELLKFYRNEQPLPHDSGEKSNVIGVDWKIDSEYIRAAFREKYDIDLLTTDIHWHDFLGYFHALKDTMINDIMSARYYKKDKDKKDPMEKAREAWELARKPCSKNKEQADGL
jgi:hypothetical protein